MSSTESSGAKRPRSNPSFDDHCRSLEARVDEMQDNIALLEMDVREASEVAAVAQADVVVLQRQREEMEARVLRLEARAADLEETRVALETSYEAASEEKEEVREALGSELREKTQQLTGARTTIRSLMQSVQQLSERSLRGQLRGLNVAGLCVRLARDIEDDKEEVFAIASETFEDKVFFGFGDSDAFATKVNDALLVCLPGTRVRR